MLDTEAASPRTPLSPTLPSPEMAGGGATTAGNSNSSGGGGSAGLPMQPSLAGGPASDAAAATANANGGGGGGGPNAKGAVDPPGRNGTPTTMNTADDHALEQLDMLVGMSMASASSGNNFEPQQQQHVSNPAQAPPPPPPGPPPPPSVPRSSSSGGGGASNGFVVANGNGPNLPPRPVPSPKSQQLQPVGVPTQTQTHGGANTNTNGPANVEGNAMNTHLAPLTANANAGTSTGATSVHDAPPPQLLQPPAPINTSTASASSNSNSGGLGLTLPPISTGSSSTAGNGGPPAIQPSGSTSPFLVPRNPRDTALSANSPKRRHMLQQTAAVSLPGAPASHSYSMSHRPSRSNAGGGSGRQHRHGHSSGSGLTGGGSSGAASLGASSDNGIAIAQMHAQQPMPQMMYSQPKRRPSPHNSSVSMSSAHNQNQQNNRNGGNVPLVLSATATSRSFNDRDRHPHPNPADPNAEEQAMFESRLCEDEYGVAVRKVNSNGKSQLRYVRCIWLTATMSTAASTMVGSGTHLEDSAGGGGVGGGGIDVSEIDFDLPSGIGGVEGSIISPINDPTLEVTGGPRNRRIGRGRSRTTGNSSVMSSSNRSLSSMLGRIRRSRSVSRDPSSRHNPRGGGDSIASGMGVSVSASVTGGVAVGNRRRANTTDTHNDYQAVRSTAAGAGAAAASPGGNPSLEGPISSLGMAAMDEDDEDEARLLDSSSPLGLANSGEGAMTSPTKRMRALAWGNKKKVQIPLDRFVSVRKGKTTSRTKRNTHSSSRLLSLITNDPAHPSLDIEAPTKLDRDKFAKAFAKFLEVPLVEDSSSKNDGKSKSRSSAGASIGSFGRGRGRKGAAATVAEERLGDSKKGSRSKNYISSAATAPDLISPRSALSETVSSQQAGSASGLPPIQSAPSADEDGRISYGGASRMDASATSGSRGPSLGGYLNNASGRPPRMAGAAQSLSSSNAGVVHSHGAGSSNALLSDAAIKRVEAEGEADDAALLFHAVTTTPRKESQRRGLNPQASNVGSATAAPTNQAVSPSIKINHGHTHHHHHNGDTGEHAAEEGTVVSSLTQGFDQEIVEELHQALTELRAELDASRAEAARAVKVAEQAIQSAESCSSSDWNSTVTHKAAEAAAQAQKKSAEALAKQRIAEEKLAGERKSAQFWRRQAEAAEQEAGILTTRAIVAEVQKAEIEEALESEKRKGAAHIAFLKENYEESDKMRKAALADAAEKNRLLEIELDGTRNDLASRSEEAKMLQDTLSEVSSKTSKGKKMTFGMGRKRGNSIRGSSPIPGEGSLSGAEIVVSPSSDIGNLNPEQLLQLHTDTKAMKHQLEVLRRTTRDEISSMPDFAKEWVGRAAVALEASQAEARVLREKLAMESSMRKKLLHEVQDMKGNVRVYCRPRSRIECDSTIDTTSVPSSNVIVLHRDRAISDGDPSSPLGPMSFEFDRVFSPNSDVKEIYSEVEELVLGSLDGYNVCLMSYGQNTADKSRLMIGDYTVSLDDAEAPKATIGQQGIHLMAAQQLFTVAQHRSDRYQDVFTINIIEVHDDKLCDLLAGTGIGRRLGKVQSSPTRSRRKKRASSSNEDGSQTGVGSSAGSRAGSGQTTTKLEIRSNYDGDTIVEGAITVEVKSFDDVCRLWKECMIERSARLAEHGVNEDEYLADCHIIATLSVVSTHVTTGIGTSGKIQFVDLASSDVEVSRRNSTSSAGNPTPVDEVLSGVGDKSELKFSNASLSTLLEVVAARSQFSRNVPYRDSTLTHLLRDSLTADTKFLFLANISTEKQDIQHTASALRFASLIRKVNIGSATKHTVSLA